MYSNPPRAIIDFESRSTCSLRACGSWKYSLDPTTEVLCLAFRLPYWERGRTGLWHPAFPHLGIQESSGTDLDDLTELFRWVMQGKLVEAHGAWFERGIWVNQCSAWPQLQPEQWRCSAAKAAAHALPRGLEAAITAMRIPDVHKDTEGQKVMKSMVKPRKPIKRDWQGWRRQHAPCHWCDATGRMPSWKKDGSDTAKGVQCPMCGGCGHKDTPVPPMPLLWPESVELMERLWAYNRQDVLAEERLSEELPDLNAFEQRLYTLDQVVNERGFNLDREAVGVALSLIDIELSSLNDELKVITGGEVEKATQRERMKDWLESQGLKLYDTTAETLDEILDQDPEEELPPWVARPEPHVRRAIEIMRTAGRSSTKKFVAMEDWMCPDDRVRGALLFHGATTGRWTGAGVQPHNFPKAALYEEVP